MNRPRRPGPPPPRKKKPSGPPRAAGGPPRRRSCLDYVPSTDEYRFRILSTGADRNALMTFAEPTEMLVIHALTRAIEEAYREYHGRAEDFWRDKPDMVAEARKLDEVLATISERRGRA